jgi:chorismate mutase
LPMAVRAIRGATQVGSNTEGAIAAGTVELLSQIIESNNLKVEEIISILFTASPDLTASFPAAAVRSLGLSDTPLICAVEIAVPGSLLRTIRVMAHVESNLSKGEISHIYLHGAKALRADIAQ